MSTTALVSPLPPEECAERLQAAIDSSWWNVAFGSKPVRGRATARSFCLTKRISYRNSFQTVLSGTFEHHVEGTLLRVKSGMHPFVVVFMTLWVGAVGLGAAAILLSAVQGRLQGNPVAALIPVFMLLFAVGLVRFGRYLARDEERFLVAFVAEVLEARVETDVYSGPKEAG